MACYNVMLVLVNNRTKNALKLQEVLTKSGCLIKVRLGLHDAGDSCADEGMIILQLTGLKEEILQLEMDLNKVNGVKAKLVELCSEWQV
jgi:hypothetical protein